MTKPTIFIDALPPDAPKSILASQKSKIRRAAAHFTHDARRQKSLTHEESKQRAARNTSGRLQQIKPKQVDARTSLPPGSRLEIAARASSHVSPQEAQSACCQTAGIDSASSGSCGRQTQLNDLQNQSVMHAQRAACGFDDCGLLNTSGESGRSEALLPITRPGPSLFFSRWTAYQEACCSNTEFHAVSSTLEAIDCFVTAVIPNNLPLYGIFEVSSHLALPIIDELITDCSFREIWSASMHNCRSVLAPSCKSRDMALIHKGRGMEMLRHDMKDPTFESNDYKLAAIACLAYISSWDGDANVADVHFGYLLRAIENRGGLDLLGFDGWLKSTILQLDSLLALQTGVSRFQAFRTPKVPSSLSSRFDVETSRQYDALPIGFRRLALQGTLSFDTVEVLARINGFASQGNMSVLSPDLTTKWRSDRYPDFYGVFSCFLTPEVGFEKLLCATLILYSVNRYSPQPDARDIITAFVVPRRYVTEHLSEIFPTNAAEKECLAWIYAVLLDSYAACKPSLLIQCESQLPGWRQDLSSIIVKFFWSPRFATACQAMCGVSVGHRTEDKLDIKTSAS